MISIKRRLVTKDELPTITDQFPIPYPQVTSVLPDNPPSAGHEFNLVRIVQDHGPQRIAAIEKEMQKLEQRIATLTKEKNQIAALVAALDAS